MSNGIKSERCSRSGSLCAEAGTRAAAPFPAPLSPLAAPFLRCAPDRFLLTKPNTSCTIEMPASLRSDGVRVHPGMPFGFLPECAFSFAGIPIKVWPQRKARHRAVDLGGDPKRPLSFGRQHR